jgi:aspartoacylase
MTSDKIRHVCISGGTHGNELTGVCLARHWQSNPTLITRAGFETHALLANPAAIKIGRRYVEKDLNRCFHPANTTTDAKLLEERRAVEIQSWLKSRCNGSYPDVLIDLHSTTANMGLSLVLANCCPFNLMLVAFLKERFPEVNAYVWNEPKTQPGFLNSLAEKGFAIEVGPVANNVAQADLILKTGLLVDACLDFINDWNSGTVQLQDRDVLVYRFREHVDYPRAHDGFPAAMIHPQFQNRDFLELKTGDPIFLGFDGAVTHWDKPEGWAVFINEAAYYEKGIAFTVADKVALAINPAEFRR